MNWYDEVTKWLNEHFMSASILLCFVIAVLRAKGMNFFNRISEGLLCSCLTVGIYYAFVSVYGANQYASIAIGAFVGYIGTDKIKELLLSKILRKLDNQEKK